MNVCKGPSRRIRVGAGAEDFDLQLDGPRGPRLLVAGLKRPPDAKVPGTLRGVDLHDDRVTQLSIPRNVYPVGIELARIDGLTLLYFTNVPPDGAASIEVFELQGDTLLWRESLADELLTTPNDLVVLPNGDLYVTNLGLPKTFFATRAVAIFKMRRGRVLHYEAATRRWLQFGELLSFPNGIATYGDRLYVNELAKKQLHIFALDTAKIVQTLELPGYPDNLRWEARGHVLNVAMHRSWMDIGRHLNGGGHPSASLGCRLRVEGVPVIEPLYDQPEFHGGSTALVHDGRLFVSQVVGDEVLVIENCT